MIESLEGRMLLSLSAADPEFHVNTYTTGAQTDSAIAADADGDFVVVWQSGQEGAGGPGIYAQRYNSSGVPQGTEIHVNSFTPSTQSSPAVAMDADGDFVVVWSSTDGANGGVRIQRFNAAGVPQGVEFGATSSGGFPTVAMDAAGDFVVAWGGFGDGSITGVFARRYDHSGVPMGGQFGVNSHTPGIQTAPAAAMDADGDFVIIWESDLQDGSDYGVYGRRFNAAGVPQGSEFRANSHTTSIQRAPDVAMDLSGDFVIAWNSYGQDGSNYGAYARRYDAAGTAQGDEFLVNTHTTNSQFFPSVAMDATGDFLIVWTSNLQDGSGYGVYAQQFSSAGAPVDGEFRVNTHTTNDQNSPAVAADRKGDFVVSWSSTVQEGVGTSTGVYAQRYQESVDSDPPIVAGVFVNGKRVLPYRSYEAPMGSILVSFSENLTDAGGAGGMNSITNPANWFLTRDGVDVTFNISSITYGYNGATNRYEATVNLTTSYTSGNFLLKLKDAVRDIPGNRLDGNLDGAAMGNMLVPFQVASFEPRGTEFQVNTYTTGTQYEPSVAIGPGGDVVVAWSDLGREAIYAQRYSPSGAPIGTEFLVSTPGMQAGDPDVAVGTAGDFIVVGAEENSVYVWRFDAGGNSLGPGVKASSSLGTFESEPDVAMDAQGRFVVAWTDFSRESVGDRGIFAQRFRADGTKAGSDFHVNTYTTGFQGAPSVSMDPGGNSVIAYQCTSQEGSNAYGIYARRYDAAGLAQGGEFLVNVYTTNHQVGASTAMDASGNFVVSWYGVGSAPGAFYRVYARLFDASGSALGGDLPIDSDTTANCFSTSVGMDADGNFTVTWFSSTTNIHMRRFTRAGVPIDPADVPVKTNVVNGQNYAKSTVSAAGDVVVVWRPSGLDGSESAIAARRYNLNLSPTVGALADNPDPVIAGNSLTLTGSGTADDSGVSGVSFYREGNGEPGLQVGAEGDFFVGTDTTQSGGVWSINFSTAPIAPGTYTYYAQATDNGGLTGPPGSTTNTVNPALGPLITAAEFHYDTLPQKLRFTFDRDVSGNDPGDISLADISLTRIGGGAVPALTMLPYGTDGTNVVTFTMDTQLADGNYRATITAAGVTFNGNPMAADYLFDFFILAGDADHNRAVDVRDLYILSLNWLGTGKTFSQADFNYDGIVNKLDLTTLAQKWQQNLAEPAPPLPAGLTGRAPTRSPTRSPTRVIDLIT